MQVAFSDKPRHGKVYRNPCKAHRITDKQPEVSEMTFVIGVARKAFVGVFKASGSISLIRVYIPIMRLLCSLPEDRGNVVVQWRQGFKRWGRYRASLFEDQDMLPVHPLCLNGLAVGM